MKEKINIIKSVTFISILLLILNLLSILFTPKNNYAEFGMMQVRANGILGEKKNTIDVLFIGDSLSYSSFSPLQMYDEQGFTSYVCGTSGQKLYDSYAFLSKALDSQTPKIVILETNALFRKFSLSGSLEAKMKAVFPFFEYHNRWKNLSINDFNNDVTYTYTDPLKGYKIKNNIKPIANSNYMKGMEKNEEIPKENYKYLERIRKKCEENNIKFVLVSATSLKNYNYSRHLTIANYANDKKIDYIDLNINNVANIDWTKDTCDKGDHLNVHGAKKESSYIAQILKEKYKLPNHKDDIEYFGWEKSLEKYRSLIG